MSEEKPENTLRTIPIVSAANNIDKIEKYREIFPHTKNGEFLGLAKEIHDEFMAIGNEALAGDMVFYAQNYAVARLGFPPSRSARINVDDTFNGAMQILTDRLSNLGKLSGEQIKEFTDAVEEMVDNTNTIKSLHDRSLA